MPYYLRNAHAEVEDSSCCPRLFLLLMLDKLSSYGLNIPKIAIIDKNAKRIERIFVDEMEIETYC